MLTNCHPGHAHVGATKPTCWEASALQARRCCGRPRWPGHVAKALSVVRGIAAVRVGEQRCMAKGRGRGAAGRGWRHGRKAAGQRCEGGEAAGRGRQGVGRGLQGRKAAGRWCEGEAGGVTGRTRSLVGNTLPAAGPRWCAALLAWVPNAATEWPRHTLVRVRAP